MIDYTTRLLTPADEAVVWEMLYHAIYVPPGEVRPSRDVVRQPELARYARDWGRPTDLGVLASDEITGAPIGAAWLRLLAGDNRGYGYIDDETPELSIAVLPAHRGAGIGTALLRRLLDLARERYDVVSLSVSRDNPAIRLYTRLGFTIVDAGDTTVTMKLELRQPDAYHL